MRTIRRLYLYLVAFISLEVVLWGLIGLARSAFSKSVGDNASQLAGALSLILVGVPVFMLHWVPAQRTAHKESEERASRVRALFTYSLLLATLIPLTQNILALINRLWLIAFSLPVQEAFLGMSQTWSDNLIGIAMNGLIAGYIFSVLGQDWEAPLTGQAYPETRRLYRYIWVLYGLTMLVTGLVQVLQFMFTAADRVGSSRAVMLADGLALLIVGVPLWFYTWRQVQQSLALPDEKDSLLRRVILYILSLIGVGGVLIPAGIVSMTIFQWLLGKPYTFITFLDEISVPLSTLIALGGLWFYYGRMLHTEIANLPTSPRRASLRRIYFYLLVFCGLTAAFIGVFSLLNFLTDLLIKTTMIAGDDWLQTRLAAALATIAVGLPVWLKTWRPMAEEASQNDENGDHARRSLVRKTFLYLVIFSGVMGTMFSAGALIYQLLNALLGNTQSDFLRTVLAMTELLLLFIGLMAYHWKALRMDTSLAAAALQARYAQFPVLVLAEETAGFAESLTTALAQAAETLPVAVHLTDHGLPGAQHSEAKAVVLPSDILITLPQTLRVWLQDFDGERIVLPTENADRWRWVFRDHELSVGVQQAAKMITALAEGEEPSAFRATSSGKVALYVLGGMMGCPLLLGLLGMILEFFF